MAGFLLGLVALTSIAGFHTGPHSHFAAGVLGLLAALWLGQMALRGEGSALLWTLLGTDLVLTGGVTYAARRAIKDRDSPSGHRLRVVQGAMGVALSDLSPDGIVRVRGEQWTATSLNGNFPAGTSIQVITLEGLRVGVWGDDPAATALFHGGEMGLSEHEARPARLD